MNYVDDTGAIVQELNELAPSLGPELLPNGFRVGHLWRFSGIPDNGQSESAWLHLSGPRIGEWKDMGNAAPGEERGDMLDLIRIKRCHGDQRAAFEEARRILGRSSGGQRIELSREEKERRAAEARVRAEQREQEAQRDRQRKASRARAMWLGARPIAGTGAEFYLRGRDLAPGSDGRWPGSLRFHDEVWHGPLQAKFPAMLACIVTADGQHIGTHRIFLQRHRQGGWGKLQGAPGTPSKMVLGNMWGGFVPIHKGKSDKSMGNMPEDEAVYITEGIEDAIAIRMVMPELRILAAVSLGNIGAIVLPPQARRIVIVADRDDTEAARDQLEASIAKQQARGLAVQLVMPPREVAGERVKDMNDWLRALARKAA